MNNLVDFNCDSRYKDRLFALTSSADIPAWWCGTPIECFIQAQNFGYPLHPQAEPQVLIVTCMEFRYALPVPANYAYVIRTPGGRSLGAELALGYVLYRGVKAILLIAHNDCGMTHLVKHSDDIAETLVKQGWSSDLARQFVKKQIASEAVRDELDALAQDYHRLKSLFKSVNIAPLFLTLSDRRVYIPKWYHDSFISSKPELNSSERVSDAAVQNLL